MLCSRTNKTEILILTSGLIVKLILACTMITAIIDIAGF